MHPEQAWILVPANVKKAENCIGGNPIEAQNSDNRFVSYKVQLSLVIVIIGIEMSLEKADKKPHNHALEIESKK